MKVLYLMKWFTLERRLRRVNNGGTRRSLGAILAAAVVLGLVGVPAATAANSTTFSGQATVLKGKVLGINIQPVADTGPLAPEGGAKHACVLSYPSGNDCVLDLPVGDQTNGAVRAELLSAKTVGHGSKSRSQASLAELSVDLNRLLGVTGLPVLSAEALTSEATAACEAGKAIVSGASELLNLEGLPKPVDDTVDLVDGQIVRKKIDLGVVVIYLDEQTTRTDPSTGNKVIEVNALRIESTTLNTNLTIGHAHADITCGNTPGGCPGDKMTGGGWITKPEGRVHFAFAVDDGLNWGHLMYMNKARNVHVQKKSFTAAVVEPYAGDPKTGYATFAGAAVNKAPRGPVVNLFDVPLAEDLGEPGHGRDTFSIALVETKDGPSVDSVAGPLEGGNLQYHRCKR